MNNVFVIGVGLIGGSFVLDIKNIYPEINVFGVDINEENLDEAIALGVIDYKATYSDLDKADLVILAIPVDKAIIELCNILDLVNEKALVIDVGSTKFNICKSVEDHPKRRNFLATHPIAGTEFSGPSAAIKGLYKGKTNIICDVEKTKFQLQELAFDIFRAIGMRIRYMNAADHDKHISYVSHLSHISSFMLGKTVMDKEKNERDIFDMAGSGFESTVRLAKSSPEMWTPIFKLNKDNVIETLEEYIMNLNNFKALLQNDDFDGVFLEMKKTNHIKEILNELN
jgi:prephenate dehydrogenase